MLGWVHEATAALAAQADSAGVKDPLLSLLALRSLLASKGVHESPVGALAPSAGEGLLPKFLAMRGVAALRIFRQKAVRSNRSRV